MRKIEAGEMCPDYAVTESAFPPYFCRKGYKLIKKMGQEIVYQAPVDCPLVRSGVVRNCKLTESLEIPDKPSFLK